MRAQHACTHLCLFSRPVLYQDHVHWDAEPCASNPILEAVGFRKPSTAYYVVCSQECADYLKECDALNEDNDEKDLIYPLSCAPPFIKSYIRHTRLVKPTRFHVCTPHVMCG